MNAIQNSYLNALLADATYALEVNVDLVSGGALRDLLKTRMTESLATYIATSFSLVTHIEIDDVRGSGFDATVWRRSDGRLYISMQGTAGLQDFLTDGQLAITGNGRDQLVDMANWWFKITTPVGQAARQIKVTAAQMGSAPGALYQLAEAATVPGIGLVSAADLAGGTEVNGHSLGGYLATAFSRLFGIQAHVDNTSTFNSAGFAPGSESVFRQYENLIGPGYGLGSFPSQDKQSNYFALHGINVTTNSFWFNQVGRRIEFFNEEGTGIHNHSMYKLTDSLVLAAALAKFDTDMSIQRANAIFEAGASQAAASLEGVLDGLRRLYGGASTLATPWGDIGDDAPSRTAYQSNLAALLASSTAQSLFGKVRIDFSGIELAGMARTDFSALASLFTLSPIVLTATNVANQALLHDVLRLAWGEIYVDWQTDKSLSLPDREAGNVTFTQRYIDDRASMLTALVTANVRDTNWQGNGGQITGISVSQPVLFQDIKSGATFTYSARGASLQSPGIQTVLFGSEGADALNGRAGEDRIYGGTGADTVRGLGGDDYLEGNAGIDTLYGGDGGDTLLGGADNDTLYGEAGRDTLRGGNGADVLDGGADGDQLFGGDGDDSLTGGGGSDQLSGGNGKDSYVFSGSFGSDTVDDLDGQGSIKVEAAVLAGGKKVGVGLYVDDATGWRYSLAADTLVVNRPGSSNQIRLRNWQRGQLGITLDDAAPTPAASGSFVGDFKKKRDPTDPVAYLFDGINYAKDGPEANAQDVITGTGGADAMQGLGGNDALAGLGGDDVIDGGDGDDLLLGGLGQDTLNGGAGTDFIYGSAVGGLYHPRFTTDPLPVTTGPEYTHGFSWVTFDNGIDANGIRTYQVLGANIAVIDADSGNVIDGGAGDDWIRAGSGNDVVHGGDDNDGINGLAGNDVLFGDGGDDVLSGDGINLPGYLETVPGVLHGADFIDGGAGNDQLIGQGGEDSLFGGSGDDKLFGDGTDTQFTPLVNHGADYLDGEDGDDYLEGDGGGDTLFGGAGNDRLWGDADAAKLPASYHGNDYLDGEEGDDALVGNVGDDSLFGGSGNDTLIGDDEPTALDAADHGDDYLDGKDGNDNLRGDGGADTLIGGAGNDNLHGDADKPGLAESANGDDHLDGGSGADNLIGGGGSDDLFGGDGDDILRGDDEAAIVSAAGNGNDMLDGGAGNDRLYGDGGDDQLAGGTGNDQLSGDAGDDNLDGGEGDDRLFGGAGNDTLNGGAGTDDLAGGSGDDTYLLGADGGDYVVDTEGANVLRFDGGPPTAAFGGNFGGAMTLTFGAGRQSTLQDALLGGISRVDSGGVVRSFQAWVQDYLTTSVTVTATAKYQTIVGGSAGDLLNAALGDAHLDGGYGNDTLTGSGGRNTYVIGVGGGVDRIVDTSPKTDAAGVAAPNRVLFGAGISAADIRLTYDATLVLLVGAAGDAVRIDGVAAGNALAATAIDSFEFADGSSLSHAQLLARGFDYAGTSGADVMSGTNLVDRFALSAGDDEMRGGGGSDMYAWAPGAGLDRIDDADASATAIDTLALAVGVAPSDLILNRSGNDLVIRTQAGLDSLTVVNQFGGAGVERFVFASGVVWAAADISAHVTTRLTDGPDTAYGTPGPDVFDSLGGDDTVRSLGGDDTVMGGTGRDTVYGGAGNDRLFGGADGDWLFGEADADTLAGGAGSDYLNGGPGDDTLDGGTGDDDLTGGSGNNTYLFGGADGRDYVLASSDATLGRRNTVLLKADVAAAGLQLSQGTERDTGRYTTLVLSIAGTLDAMTISGFFSGNGPASLANPVQQIVFASDGTTWDYATLESKVFAGTAGRDDIHGTNTANTINGQSGDDSLSGEGGNDTLLGGAGHDDLYGGADDDTLDGGDDADALLGEAGNDRLFGGAGNDSLYGGEGADVLDGGAGNDVLDGGYGDNTYLFGRGDGQDISLTLVNDAAPGRLNQLLFKAGISPADIVITRYASTDLRLAIAGTSDTFTAQNFFRGEDPFNTANSVQKVSFTDGGASWNLAELTSRALAGTAGNDTMAGTIAADVLYGQAGDDLLYGRSGNDTLYGGDGADRLYGEDGADTLAGGAGNDSLFGGPGNNVFIFGRGDGQDIIRSSGDGTLGKSNTLQFGAGILPSDLSWQSAPDTDLKDDAALELSITGTTDKLTVNAFFGADGSVASGSVQQVRFADGMVWDPAMLKSLLFGGTPNADRITGSPGADTLSGQGGADFLFGGHGDDTLLGGAGADYLNGGWGDDLLDGGAGDDSYQTGLGDDTFLFGRGDGQDVVRWDAGPDQAKTNSLRFKPGVNAADVQIRQAPWNPADFSPGWWAAWGRLLPAVDTNSLEISIAGTADKITFRNIYNDDAAGIQRSTLQRVIAADGTAWDMAALLARLFAGSLGDDTIYGTAFADSISGQAGADVLYGGAGSDVLDGGAGNDKLYGGEGNNTYLFGRGDGQDFIQAFDTALTKVNLLRLKAGIARADVVFKRIDSASGGVGTDLEVMLAGSSDKVVIDSFFAESVTSSAELSAIQRIVFADGAVMERSAIIAAAASGPGVGTVLTGGAGNDALTGGAGNDTLYGNNGDDTLNGMAGHDRIEGGAGNDRLVGGAGNDSLLGGPGNDTYVVDNAADSTVEAANGGTDTVESFVTWALAAEVENLTLVGASAINATGNATANTLRGNAASNILNGAAGADTMIGGAGDDIYVVDNTADKTTEAANEGTDTVHSTLTWSLANNLENLTLLGTAAINGTGNALANVLTGNSASNMLTGNAGNDTLDGGAGADTLVGGTGNDTYVFGRGHGADLLQDNDTTTGNTDVMRLLAGIATDQLWFRKAGNDMEVSVIGTADKATVQSWYLGNRYHLEQFKTSGGKTLLDSKVQTLVNAMASFTPPALGQTSLPASYQSALAPVIAANWGP